MFVVLRLRDSTECEYAKSQFVVLPQSATIPVVLVRSLNFKKRCSLRLVSVDYQRRPRFSRYTTVKKRSSRAGLFTERSKIPRRKNISV